jgi:hypothetical protein
MGGKNQQKIIEHVGNVDNFVVGTVRGGWFPSPDKVPMGRLADSAGAHGWGDLDPDKPVYVVYSYETPVAWRQAGGPWVSPRIQWSVTTSHHQSLVRQGMRIWDAKCEQVVAHL